MNINHLGDAYDHWKGSIIKILNESRNIQNLAVEPMFTDKKTWGQVNVQTYARLLNLWPNDIQHTNLPTWKQWKGRRNLYFKEIRYNGDLFIDPDTGIGTNGRKYIRVDEIGNLLDKKRVLMIYQHFAHKTFENQCRIIRNKIRQIRKQATYCVYQCGQVAMIFISRNNGRIRAIEKVLKAHLCGTAERRIRSA